MKPKKSLGPDGIPQYIYKACADFVAAPLVYIINLILDTRTFPRLWTLSAATPVPKPGDTRDITNYRPIANISVPNKIFEKVVFLDLYPQTHNRLSQHQHGFMRSRSVCTNLMEFTHYIAKNLDELPCAQIDTVYTDFQKAFDKVNHRILIQKLRTFGFSESLIELFRSYLQGRKQYVAYKGSRSFTYSCPSGVPQGSNLGPFLFLLFVDDLSLKFEHSIPLLYADDLKVFRKISTDNDRLLLQKDLNALGDWCISNRLPLNVGKCKVITYTRKTVPLLTKYELEGQTLEKVDVIRDLGLFVDTELAYTTHVQTITNKAKRNLGLILRQAKCFHDSMALKVLYYSLVRSHTDLSCLFLNLSANSVLKTIERVQKIFLRCLYYKDFTYIDRSISYKELTAGYEILSIKERKIILMMKFLHKLIHGRIDSSALLSTLDFKVPSRPGRLGDTFTLPKTRTNILQQKSPVYELMATYNKIQKQNRNIDIFFEEHHQFEKKVMEVVLSHR